jgi:hypothetical protein
MSNLITSKYVQINKYLLLEYTYSGLNNLDDLNSPESYGALRILNPKSINLQIQMMGQEIN